MSFLRRNALWLIPILIMFAITPFTPELDMAIARWTYYTNIAGDPSSVHTGFSSNSFFDVMYKHGCIPSQLTCGIATLIFLLSFYIPKLQKMRAVSLTLSLCMIIGAGIITHQLLKETWGRPRPRHIIEFGGKQDFRPYYIPRITPAPEPSKSFPSGHSTCGFYFFCLYFLGRRYKSPLLKSIGIIAGGGLGIFLSMARIVQGGHFLSDVLFAALLMWETAYFVDWLVFDYKIIPRLLSTKKSTTNPSKGS
ncbi:MAG: hypothetical protein JWO53_111 [Chlamydiia bacterium]|nr:hypothetical protein [Chlamydiia bacterium]